MTEPTTMRLKRAEKVESEIEVVVRFPLYGYRDLSIDGGTLELYTMRTSADREIELSRSAHYGGDLRFAVEVDRDRVVWESSIGTDADREPDAQRRARGYFHDALKELRDILAVADSDAPSVPPAAQ